MKVRNFISVILSLLLISSIFLAVSNAASFAQEKSEKELSPKYKAFLAETQLIMTSEEKKAFLELKSDEERNKFIEKFWESRGGRGRGIRENIVLFQMLRMTQDLDLTEEQTAKIFPKINQIEKEKFELRAKVREQLRELRLALKNEKPDEKKIDERVNGILELRHKVESLDKELESFLLENLTAIQRGKYMIFAPEFYQELRDKLERARGLRQGSRNVPMKK
jgi:Spy/CpxP family protein refolding chaperone